MSVGDTIRYFRKKQCLSQKQLAEKMNVTQQTIAQYEQNKRTPKVETLKKFSNALNIDYFELVKYIVIPNEYIDIEDTIDTITNLYEHEILSNFFYSLKDTYANLIDYVDYSKDALKVISEYCDIITKAYIENDDKYFNEDILYAYFRQLNERGKKEAVKRIEELTQIKKYTEPIDTQTENEKEV